MLGYGEVTCWFQVRGSFHVVASYGVEQLTISPLSSSGTPRYNSRVCCSHASALCMQTIINLRGGPDTQELPGVSYLHFPIPNSIEKYETTNKQASSGCRALRHISAGETMAGRYFWALGIRASRVSCAVSLHSRQRSVSSSKCCADTPAKIARVLWSLSC
jgi:hypothetical protein